MIRWQISSAASNTNAADHRKSRAQAFTTWADVTGIAAAC